MRSIASVSDNSILELIEELDVRGRVFLTTEQQMYILSALRELSAIRKLEREKLESIYGKESR